MEEVKSYDAYTLCNKSRSNYLTLPPFPRTRFCLGLQGHTNGALPPSLHLIMGDHGIYDKFRHAYMYI